MANNDILRKTSGTQLIFADHGTDFVGGAAKTSLEQSGSNDVQIDTTDVADAAGRESAKVDLGATRAPAYSVMAACEMAATPTTGEVIEFYWAPSPDATAANGNVFEIDGVDGAASSGPTTLAELVAGCQFIGNLICSADATGTVLIGFVGILVPAERYGILIIKNESGAAFHSDAVETHIVFSPIVDVVV